MRRKAGKQMGKLEITDMSMEDLEAVTAIEREIFSMPWSRSGFEASVNAKNTVYLTARLDKETVGYCGMLCCMDEAEITNVAVRESARRLGVARAMLGELLRRGQEDGVQTFLLEVRKSNQAAISLYEKLGFQTCGIRKHFYEKPPEDAVVMWKQ